MRLLDKYIVYSSIFALFTEDFYFHYIIDIKLYYLLLLSNFLLLSVNKTLKVPKNLLIIIGLLCLHGIVSYTLFQNPIKSLIAQVVGISLSSIYYYNFIKIYGTKKVFKVYLDFAFAIAVLAIPMFYLEINTFTYNRLNGIMSEPAHYAAIMLPACYVFFRDKMYVKFILILITIVLSKSSIGFIGLLLIILIPLIKIKYFLKYAIIAVVVVAAGSYYVSTKWNEPVNENESNAFVRRLKETKESISALNTGKFKEYTNLSTYAFLSNSFITKQIFLSKPLGAGLGSYKHEYDKYNNKLSPPAYLKTLHQTKINKTDANSLFLRMTADLGVFAFLMFIYFFYNSFNIFKDHKKIIRQSTFFYLILKLIREGHYFPPEFYFFLLIFLKDFDEDTAHS